MQFSGVALALLDDSIEETLQLNDYRRSRTILRIDAGGGSLEELNWLLSRGYHLHGKDISAKRAEGWASTVKGWYDDPQRPGRQVGWAQPETTPDYVRPVKRPSHSLAQAQRTDELRNVDLDAARRTMCLRCSASLQVMHATLRN